MTGSSRSKAGDAVEVVVTVEQAHHHRLSEVVRALHAAGLVDTQTLAAAGLVTGRATPRHLAALKAVAGVQAVEASETVQIAPPDAGVQ